MRTIQVWCCNSSFYGQKSNVSAWMSIAKHTGTHPRHSMHSLDTHHVFAVTTVGQKAERQTWLSSPKSTTLNEMNKTWDLNRKNSWLMNIPFIFPSFFSSYNSNSVQFSHSVMSDSLQPHGLQHARPPCPSQTPAVCSNSCPLSQWYHPIIPSSVVPFASCLQSFQASGSFQMSQFSTSGGQSIGVSASASVLPVNIQDWFPLGWTDWISLQSKGLSRVFSLLQQHSSKASILECSTFFIVQLSHPYMTTGKATALARWIFVGKVISLFFNMLSRLVITFLPKDA